MPLVTLTLPAGRPAASVSAVLDAVHASLVAAGVPADDRFQRVLELPPERLRIDPRYPDAGSPRGADFLLIEILWSVGRSVKIKRALLADLMARLRDVQVDTEQVMVVFQETAWENWAFAGGRQIHA
ncbi:MAG: tautomerase family protein [Piscinibacter sp.]|nr:tautomerase family protein [Piscinibacter sp.]